MKPYAVVVSFNMIVMAEDECDAYQCARENASEAWGDEREAFEALMRSRGEDYLYRRDVPGCEKFGEYCRQNVQDQWEVWQARAALAAAPEQAGEPVAWMTKSDGYVFYGYNKPDRVEEELVPLYTAPPPASTNRLTDEQREGLANTHSCAYGNEIVDGTSETYGHWWTFDRDGLADFARAIIAATEGK